MRMSVLVVLLVAVLSSGAAVSAATPPLPEDPQADASVSIPGTEADVRPTAPAQLSEADVSAWLDGFLPYALARGDVAGAVVTVVKDGEVLAQRGYGHADVAARRPVDPETTLFRPGSVSKLFTWTAIMQLVEQGKIGLDTDINTYLDFAVPASGDPITVRHLLTHTTGLEERIKRLMSTDPEGPEPIGEYLKAWVPAQIFAPGTTPAYSNYATSLAGYIVERVSGQSFDDYIDQHILQPLDMRYASFRQPLPPHLRPHMSQGYRLGSGDPQPFEMVVSAPAGSLSASGVDMARFMIAHLQTAAGQDSPILRAGTAALMYQPQTVFTPGLNAMALGFYETSINGHRVIGHGGDTQWFHSYLHLFLEHGVGLFVSVNSAGKDGVTGPIRSELFQGFADRYFPAAGNASVTAVDAETAAAHARQLAGHTYVSSRRTGSRNFMRLAGISQVGFSINDDGTISAEAIKGTNGVPIRWRQVEPYVWQDEAGSERLVAVLDERGGIAHWSIGAFAPIMQFEPVASARSTSWLQPLLLLALGSLALSAVFWPIAAIVRRRYGQRLQWTIADLRIRRLARLAAGVIVATWLGWLQLLSYVMGDYTRFDFGLDKWIVLLSALGVLGGVFGTLSIGWHAFRSWATPNGGWARIWNGWLVIAALISLYSAWIFGLLSFSTNY